MTLFGIVGWINVAVLVWLHVGLDRDFWKLFKAFDDVSKAFGALSGVLERKKARGEAFRDRVKGEIRETIRGCREQVELNESRGYPLMAQRYEFAVDALRDLHETLFSGEAIGEEEAEDE